MRFYWRLSSIPEIAARPLHDRLELVRELLPRTMLRPSCVLTVFLLPFPAITATAYGVRVGWSELAVVLTFVLATAASILLANHVVLRALHASVVERLASAEPGEPLP